MYGIFLWNISAEYLSQIFENLFFFKKFKKCGQHCTLVPVWPYSQGLDGQPLLVAPTTSSRINMHVRHVTVSKMSLHWHIPGE